MFNGSFPASTYFSDFAIFTVLGPAVVVGIDVSRPRHEPLDGVVRVIQAHPRGRVHVRVTPLLFRVGFDVIVVTVVVLSARPLGVERRFRRRRGGRRGWALG